MTTEEILREYRDKAVKLHCEYLLGIISYPLYSSLIAILDKEYATKVSA